MAEFLKAEFVPASRYGCQVPDTVSYLNTSVNAASYDWRFGNNTTSIAKLPTVVFEFDNLLNKNRQRSYSDTLIITSARGCKSRMILDSSVVIILPRANFTPNPFDGIGTMQGCAPLTVNFKDKSVYNSKVDNIASYKWDFMGESKPSRTIKEFTEVFNKDTITQVRLTVTTQKGCVAATTYDFGSGHKQTPDFDISNSSHTLCASERVNFINKTTDMDKVNSITWIWGDGESGSIDDSHLYTKIGPMSVTLEVSSYGCKEKIFKEDFVTILGPIATFSYSTDCKKPYEKSFTSKIIDATNFSWNLGDGTVVTDVAAFKHTYLAKGDYSVSLNAINGSCTSSPEPSTIMVRDLEVKASLVAPLSCVSSPYLFNSSKTMGATKWINGTVAATYLYDFGDGSKPIFTNDTVVTHRFAKRGNYKVTLVAKDENQCADTLISYQRIYRPYSDFAPVYLTGCMPIDFSFTNNSKADTLSSILSSKWIFGDGNSSTLTNPSHQYIKWGNYNVSLISTDNKGCSDTIVKVGAVNATYPNPKFVALDTTLCVGDTAYFSSIVPTTIASYLWTYPDGSTSVAPKGKYKFSADGKFDVKLYVVDKHGCDTLGTQLNFIKVQKPPVVDFTASPLVSNCYPTEITFTDQSVSAYLGGWRWNFGDAKGFSYRQNPQHIYIRPGKFDVKLVATTTYGCSDSLTKIKYVNPKGPFAKVIARDTICRDASMSLEMAEPFNVYSFKWDLGDGSVQLDTTINHSYRDVGYFYPGLFLVSDTTHSCDKFIRDTVYVSETLARYKLNNSSSKGCVPYQISYSNLSTHANQWKWEFGEGSSTNEFEPDITYPTDGLYSGKLSVRNELGCTDSVLLKPITVFPLPVVTISRDTFICLNSSTLLEATGGVVYKWTPELGLSDVASSTPYASPNNNTHYTVLVTDINSCQRQESVMITVQQYPVAQAPDSSIIVGESVHLNVNALDIKSYYWSPNYNISCTDCADPVVQPLQDTIYTVTVQDTANCFIKSYSTKISVERKYSVDLPTAFTPNGDGVNDEVFVKGWGIKELITFRVFNRFGQMIFETNDINKGWNGEGNGVAQMGDTYQFIVKILTYNDAVITKTGTIKIIK